MGYATKNTVYGNQGAGTSFMSIGGSGTMADLKVTGYGDNYEDGGITAVKLDIYGRDSGAKMCWVDADYGVDGVWYGWYDSGWETELGESITLDAGEAVWLMCPTDGWKLNWPSPLAKDAD